MKKIWLKDNRLWVATFGFQNNQEIDESAPDLKRILITGDILSGVRRREIEGFNNTAENKETPIINEFKDLANAMYFSNARQKTLDGAKEMPYRAVFRSIYASSKECYSCHPHVEKGEPIGIVALATIPREEQYDYLVP